MMMMMMGFWLKFLIKIIIMMMGFWSKILIIIIMMMMMMGFWTITSYFGLANK